MKRLLGVIIAAVILSLPLAHSELDMYVSNPGKIPDFHNFSTPQLEPGQSGKFSLDILNRYNESLEDITIIAEIYHRADIDESEDLDLIPSSERPYIQNTVWSSNIVKEENSLKTTDFKSATFEIDVIQSNETITLEFEINTNEDTKEGTYFVRFEMDFRHNETERQMQSRGHWGMNEWDDTTNQSNVPSDSPGNINLNILDVDGIIPDSSFGVKKDGKPVSPSVQKYFESIPYFNVEELDFTADSWDIHGLIVSKGGTNIFTRGPIEKSDDVSKDYEKFDKTKKYPTF